MQDHSMGSINFNVAESAMLSAIFDTLSPGKRLVVIEFLKTQGANDIDVNNFLHKLDTRTFGMFFPEYDSAHEAVPDAGKIDTFFVVPNERMARQYRRIVSENVEVVTPTIRSISGRVVPHIFIHEEVDLDADIAGEGSLRELLKQRQRTFVAPTFRILS